MRICEVWSDSVVFGQSVIMWWSVTVRSNMMMMILTRSQYSSRCRQDALASAHSINHILPPEFVDFVGSRSIRNHAMKLVMRCNELIISFSRCLILIVYFLMLHQKSIRTLQFNRFSPLQSINLLKKRRKSTKS